MIRWKVKKGQDAVARSGHPWIARDLLESTGKSVLPGSLVEVVDSKDQFVGWGYGNHKSRIAVRLISRRSDDRRNLTIDFFVDRALAAWKMKKAAGIRGSFRLIYSEGDQLPGLICDYYLVERPEGPAQIFSAQILTAGMERILMDPVNFFRRLAERGFAEGLTEITWEQSVVVLRNDSSSRKHEGLDIDVPRVLQSLRGIELDQSVILVRATHGPELLKFSCDLYQGQKTGFFLDQFQNIFQVNKLAASLPPGRVQILDLCCYVGHWSVQLAHRLQSMGREVDVTLVDVSASALARARANVQRLGIEPRVLKKDVLRDLGDLPDRFFDIVIADPPAFAKSKKDAPQAEHAYMKLNTQSFRLTKPGGLMAACSCSGAVREAEFTRAVEKALSRSGRSASLLGSGGHSVDHPVLENFPEGHYLKMNVFRVGE